MTPNLIGSRSWIGKVLLVCALIWFVGLEYRGLFMPDEGRYADIAREMLDSGDWVTPRLNGLKYFEKPPLQYWVTAAAFSVFGADEWTARLWPAVTGLLCIAFTALAARRLAPDSSPGLTAMILAGSWGLFLGSQFLTLDMGVTFFLTVAMLSYVLSRRADIPPWVQRNWMLLAWAAAACAVLSKGLIGVVIPGLALAAYVAVERDLAALRRLYWIPGLALFAVIAVPWFVLVQERNPEFFRFFFVYEHFERYLLPDHHRPGPWWYYVPVVLVGLWPWTPALPAAVAKAWKAPAAAGFRLDRFLAIWAGVVIVFFSASHSKLPGYVLPALPPILLLFARHYPQLSQRLRRSPALACAASGLLVALLAAVLLGFWKHLPWKGVEVEYSIWLLAAASALSAAGFAGLEFFRRAQPEQGLAASALGSLIAIQLALSGTHVVDEHYSSERLVEQIVDDNLRFPSDSPFYSVASYDQSVPFYLGRSVTLVAYKDELAPGIAAEPHKYIGTVDEFLGLWKEDREAFAIMKPPLYEKLSREGLPGRILVRDARWIIVARR